MCMRKPDPRGQRPHAAVNAAMPGRGFRSSNIEWQIAMNRAEVVSVFSLSSRVVAGLLGGYAFVWGFTTLVIASALAVGTDYQTQNSCAFLLAFLVFLVAFLWAFACRAVCCVSGWCWPEAER